MKPDQRRRYSDLFKRQLKTLENKHIEGLYKAMMIQIHTFTRTMRDNGIEAARAEMERDLMNFHIAETVRELYVECGIVFAKQTAKEIKREANRKSGNIGENEMMVADIIQYFRTHLLNGAVIPITETTKAQIRKVLSNAIAEGWGVDEIAARLESPELTKWRAKLIARTEILKASHIGGDIAAQDSEFITQKEWISAGDDRVRDAHDEVDGTVIDEHEFFIVGGERMSGPGDPSASADNLCNCRCTLAYVPKRDKRGNLIMKN